MADEFEQQGLDKALDKHGFETFSGLNTKRKNSGSRTQRTEKNEPISKEHSAFKRMTIAPGVSLKEQKDPKHKPKFDSDYIKTSGGVFKPKVKDGTSFNSTPYAMSMRDYRKLSGTRTFYKSNNEQSSRSSLRDGKERAPLKSHADNFVRVINMDKPISSLGTRTICPLRPDTFRLYP